MKQLAWSVLTVAALFAHGVVHAASDFIVKKGETFEITPAVTLNVHYNRLILEDEATLIVRVPDVKFNAGELKIGNNVVIMGNGVNGVDGKSPADKGGVGLGNGGWPGDNGGAGTDGTTGANVAFVAGTLRPIGSNLRVELRGGQGGDGGAGGAGGRGGSAECHQRAGDGGNGGNGGPAGRGGDGGKFSIKFSSFQGEATFMVLDADTFNLSGGAAGTAGARGGGGHGGDGCDCPVWLGGARSGGGVGGNGRPGAASSAGVTRKPDISAFEVPAA